MCWFYRLYFSPNLIFSIYNIKFNSKSKGCSLLLHMPTVPCDVTIFPIVPISFEMKRILLRCYMDHELPNKIKMTDVFEYREKSGQDLIRSETSHGCNCRHGQPELCLLEMYNQSSELVPHKSTVPPQKTD